MLTIQVLSLLLPPLLELGLQFIDGPFDFEGGHEVAVDVAAHHHSVAGSGEIVPLAEDLGEGGGEGCY